MEGQVPFSAFSRFQGSRLLFPHAGVLADLGPFPSIRGLLCGSVRFEAAITVIKSALIWVPPMRTKRTYRIAMGMLVFRYRLRTVRGVADPESVFQEVVCAKDGAKMALTPDRDHDSEDPVFWSCPTCGNRVVIQSEISKAAWSRVLQRWTEKAPSDE